MIPLLIDVIVVLAILAILWWVVINFNLPEPFRIVVIAVGAIGALLFLASLLQ